MRRLYLYSYNYKEYACKKSTAPFAHLRRKRSTTSLQLLMTINGQSARSGVEVIQSDTSMERPRCVTLILNLPIRKTANI